ncbi:MAG: TetR/AcrR family transcriptional regulator [Microbacterium sp.]
MSTTSSESVRKPLAERLVQEALMIVAERGPNSLSLREVQRRAQVSPAAAYRHFADRSALLLAVAQECAGLLADHVAAGIARLPRLSSELPAARARLRAGCEAYLSFAISNPGLYHAIFYSDEQLDELSAPSERARGEGGDGGFTLLVDLLTDVTLAAGGTVLDVRDPVVVWSSLHGLALLRLDAALRSLSADAFAAVRERTLETIVGAVPVSLTA